MLCTNTVAFTTTITGTCSTTKCVTTSCGTATTSTWTTTTTESEQITVTEVFDYFATIDLGGALATSAYNDALNYWSAEDAAAASGPGSTPATTSTPQATGTATPCDDTCKLNRGNPCNCNEDGCDADSPSCCASASCPVCVCNESSCNIACCASGTCQWSTTGGGGGLPAKKVLPSLNGTIAATGSTSQVMTTSRSSTILQPTTLSMI